jgi:hypothetical protein
MDYLPEGCVVEGLVGSVMTHTSVTSYKHQSEKNNIKKLNHESLWPKLYTATE